VLNLTIAYSFDDVGYYSIDLMQTLAISREFLVKSPIGFNSTRQYKWVAFAHLRKRRTSPRGPWRTGLFVIQAMVTGGQVARRKPLSKSTNYPVRSEG